MLLLYTIKLAKNCGSMNSEISRESSKIKKKTRVKLQYKKNK